jgi:hypothetical protein
MIQTIERTVDIPADGRFSITAPRSVSSGRCTVILTFVPENREQSSPRAKTAKEQAADMWAQMPTLEDCKREAAEKTARRLAAGKAPFQDARIMSNDGRKFFEGVDPVEYQRKLRNEWPD